MEDYGGNSLPGTIEAVTQDAESQDEDDVIELQGEELVESLRCQQLHFRHTQGEYAQGLGIS